MRCRTVVLAASACESARLLLNSKGKGHQQGLANSSGKVGRYLMDTVGSSMSAMIPALSGMPHYNSDGYGSHIYVPWWMSDRHKELNFPRGYHIETGGGYGMPGIGSFTGVVNRTEGYGAPMKQAIRDEYGTSVGLSGRGEMIPNEQSVLRDRSGGEGSLGHPVLRFHWQWSDHELNQVRHMQATFREILEGMGDRVNAPQGGGRGARARRAARAAGATDRAGGSADRARPALRPVSRRRRWASAAGRRLRRTRPGRQSLAAAPSSTRWAPSAWATTRRRAP